MRTFPFGLFVFDMGRNKVNKSQEEKRQQKNRAWKQYQYGRSKAQFVSDYLLITAAEQHRQATAFFDKLKGKYPQKRDVRKTDEFRYWQAQQSWPNNIHTTSTPVENTEKGKSKTAGQKEMQLRIPLMPPLSNAKEIPDLAQQSREDLITLDQIPSDVMEHLITEIQADPTLNQIFNDFNFEEEVLDEATIPAWEELDIGTDIDIDDRLEQELNDLVHF